MTKVTVADGSFDAPLWLPESGSGPGLVLIQEIFGLDDYLKSVAADRSDVVGVAEVTEVVVAVEVDDPEAAFATQSQHRGERDRAVAPEYDREAAVRADLRQPSGQSRRVAGDAGGITDAAFG